MMSKAANAPVAKIPYNLNISKKVYVNCLGLQKSMTSAQGIFIIGQSTGVILHVVSEYWLS